MVWVRMKKIKGSAMSGRRQIEWIWVPLIVLGKKLLTTYAFTKQRADYDFS